MELFGVFAGVPGAFRVNRLKSGFGCRRVFALFFKCFSSPGPPGAGAGGNLIDFWSYLDASGALGARFVR